MKKVILLVEDDPDIQDYIEIVLAPIDIEIIKVGNGQQALEIVDSDKKIDLVLLDAMMPVMNGEEFFRELRRERNLNVPVIVCSVDDDSLCRLKEIGEIQGVFNKLTDGQELREQIGQALSL